MYAFGHLLVCASSHRAAYDVPIVVYGIGSDSAVGSQPINAIITMETEKDNFPCPLPTAGRLCYTPLCCVVDMVACSFQLQSLMMRTSLLVSILHVYM